MSDAWHGIDAAEFAALRAAYCRRLVGTGECIAAASAGGDRTELRKLLHRLKGSGASYGFPELSRAAAECERAMEAQSAGNEVDAVAALLRAVATCAANGGAKP